VIFGTGYMEKLSFWFSIPIFCFNDVPKSPSFIRKRRGSLCVGIPPFYILERKTVMSNLRVSSPWISYIRKVYLLFKEDDEISMKYDAEGNELLIYVNNATKADALAKKLPVEKSFGNVTLKITIIPSNTEDSNIDIFRKIFNGNPICKEIVTEDAQYAIGMNHVVFENKVVQYFNDQLDDPYGVKSALYEELARDVFEESDGVFFNTQVVDDFDIWP